MQHNSQNRDFNRVHSSLTDQLVVYIFSLQQEEQDLVCYTSFTIVSVVTGERISIGSSFVARARNFAVLIPALIVCKTLNKPLYVLLFH